MTNNNDDDDHDDDNDYYYDHNNNYDDDLDKELDEALESIERQCKEGGLSGKETLKESISFIGEQQKQAILRYHSVLRVNMPLLMSDEKLRRKVIKADNEMVRILQRQLDESIRMRKELREKMEKEKDVMLFLDRPTSIYLSPLITRVQIQQHVNTK
ncbi:MAG TPA: hypothetical protein VE544_13025 [Nitrososphaeraceae archaeon]|nr:hypothetical protein [Nitrososphaeraceae archaeon]